MTTAEDDFTSGRDVAAYVDIHTAQKRLPEHTHISQLILDGSLHMVLTLAKYSGFRNQ